MKDTNTAPRQATAKADDTRVLDLRNSKDFALLHRETYGLLIYVAGQLGMPKDEREDVAQQAYVRLLESKSEFTLAHAKGYLVCAVRSLVIDVKRRATSRKTSVFDDWTGIEGRALWESDARHDAVINALSAALDRMSQEASTAMLAWFYRDGMSVKDIKARTGEATGTITAKLCRLRRQLAPRLSAEIEAALTTSALSL